MAKYTTHVKKKGRNSRLPRTLSLLTAIWNAINEALFKNHFFKAGTNGHGLLRPNDEFI
jgi:hypothetical protein